MTLVTYQAACPQGHEATWYGRSHEDLHGDHATLDVDCPTCEAAA